MPSYNIICKNCNHKADLFVQTISKYEELIKGPCPSCGKNGLTQDMSEAPAKFILKGLGWVGRKLCGHSDKTRRGSQEALDDALRENDNLQYMADKKKGAWGKRDDDIKRAEDRAASDGTFD